MALNGCATGRNNQENPWSATKAPAPVALGGQAQAIGSYSAGCVRGAISLQPAGVGYQVMRIMRGRFYGHPALIDFIERLGARVARAQLGSLLIGDLGQPRGGPTLSSHRSHQNGLDVDIWFGRVARSLNLDERENFASISVITADGKTVDPAAWKAGDFNVLRLAAEMPGVERIFVNAAIKKELCARAPLEKREWLAKLRPWWGHDDHFHVRLACIGDGCKGQEAIPVGDGCDATLEWWFSEEAKAKGGADDGPAKMPELPAACTEVLKL